MIPVSLRWPALLWLSVLCACAHRGRTLAETTVASVQQPQTTPAGRVADGVYLDDRWDFKLPIPTGWTATPGVDPGQLRVSLTHEETGTKVEVWAFPGTTDTLRPRGDCQWDFSDRAHYRVLGLSEQTTTGTCTPNDPDGDLVFGWLLPGTQVTYQAEIHVPATALVTGRRAAQAALSGLSRSGDDAGPR